MYLPAFNELEQQFCLYIFLSLNKQNVKKCFMIKFHIHIQRIYIHFKIQNTTLKQFKLTVAKFYEKVLRLSMTSTTKVKVEQVHLWLKSHITKHFSLGEYHFFG